MLPSDFLNPYDIFVVVPLHHPPVLLKEDCLHTYGRRVGLVDPLDMLPVIYEPTERSPIEDKDYLFPVNRLACLTSHISNIDCSFTLNIASDPIALWRRCVEHIAVEESLRESIEKELQSSVEWQVLAYQNPPICPSLRSPPIQWEQSLLAGHPTHPMHRARMVNNGPSDFDWYHPLIRFVRVPRSSVHLLGYMEDISLSLAQKAADYVGRCLPPMNASVFLPVHELQVDNILAKFPDVEVLQDICIPGLAQSSIRTVIVPHLPGMALKLSVGVKVSSALRTISHFTADFGPRFSSQIVPKLSVNQEILSVELEPASATYNTPDPDIAKHLTVVMREEYQPAVGEVVIVCAALLEMDHAGIPASTSAVQHVFNLRTEESCAKFLDRYIRIACEAFLPALLYDGVAFEAHAQNVLARFDKKTGELLGFIFRDLGGLRIHPPTLRMSTGVDFQFLPGHCIATETLDEIYPKFYHTFVHNHIQRLIRVLGLHYSGVGWKILREHMESVIPCHHRLRKLWLHSDSKFVSSKCLLRMRIRDSYRDMVYSPYPNLIQYDAVWNELED